MTDTVIIEEIGDSFTVLETTTDTVVVGELVGAVVIQEVDAQIVEMISPGPQGPGGTLAIGPVNTVENSEPAAVRNLGNQFNAIWELDIPKGAKGDTGDSGPNAIGGFDIEVSMPGNGDVLAFSSNRWVNNPQSNLTDGGNF